MKIVALFVFVICSFTANAQVVISGKVTAAGNKPLKSASVGLLTAKKATQTDSAGLFTFYVPNSKRNDTLIISSIGYQPLKIAVQQAKQQNHFILSEYFKPMKDVKLHVFGNRSTYGNREESAAYFRSWSFDSTHGEIGRIFSVPHEEYKIHKVQFKVNYTCSNCSFKLHIRNVINGKPGEEILKDSVGMSMNRHVWLDKDVPSFDLSDYDMVMTNKKIYVGVEVIGCVKKDALPCSLCFVGTEKGGFMFKEKGDAEWEESFSDMDIYMKLELVY